MELGRAARHAAGADAAPALGAAEHLPVFVLGAWDHRAAAPLDGRPSRAGGTRFRAARRAARLPRAPTGAQRRAGSILLRRGPHASLVQPLVVPSDARAGPQGRRTLDR